MPFVVFNNYDEAKNLKLEYINNLKINKAMKYIYLTLLFFISTNQCNAQSDSIIKSAYFKIEYPNSKIKPIEYTEYYNKNGLVDSVYRKPAWADSAYTETLSEMYFYLPNGKIDYILHYDYDVFIGPLLYIDSYIYIDNKDKKLNDFRDSNCVVNEKFIYGNGNVVEFKMYEKDQILPYINFWEIHFYDSLNRVTKIIDLIYDNYTTYKYNSKGLLVKQTYLTTFNRSYFFEDEQADESEIYEFNYKFNQNNHWIIREKINIYDEDSIMSKIHRTIKYY